MPLRTMASSDAPKIIPPKREVIHIPSNKMLRAVIINNIVDVVPSSSHWRPSSLPMKSFLVGQNAQGPYDPVIDLNHFIVTYGVLNEFNTFKKYDLSELLRHIQKYIIHSTFSIYSKARLDCLSKYSSVWAVLAKVKLVIDAEGVVRKSGNERNVHHIITVKDWLKMNQNERFDLLLNVLGDKAKANAALRYLTSPAFTGVHLLKQQEEEPWGIVLVLDIKLAYSLTPEILSKVYGRHYDRHTMVGWLRKPRFLNAGDVLKLVMEAPIVLSRQSINSLCGSS